MDDEADSTRELSLEESRCHLTAQRPPATEQQRSKECRDGDGPEDDEDGSNGGDAVVLRAGVQCLGALDGVVCVQEGNICGETVTGVERVASERGED